MNDASGAIVVLAGATGDLGHRIARALVVGGVSVRALTRPGTSQDKLTVIQATGAEPVVVDFNHASALAQACAGAVCVVSALNGLAPTILGTQGQLLDAAVAASVPRLMPSDFSLDFTKTTPGGNRNVDLRRHFMARVDAAPIRATSVLNGAFADMLTGKAPLLLHKLYRVLFWGSPDQPYDFTTKDDVAAFTAKVALDPNTPRILRIAGDTVSPRDLAGIMTTLDAGRWGLLRAGGTGLLGRLIAVARALSPGSDVPFPACQGMQYMRDMATGLGRLHPLDNQRYGECRWTPVRDVVAATV